MLNTYGLREGFTVDTIQLNTGVAYTVDSNCPECEDSDSASYCMPVIRARCIEADSVACVSGSNVVTTKHSVESQHVCSGDSINWSSMEFDYTLTPVGITCAYGGTAGHVEFTIDCALVEPGTYYIPVRVAATSGIKSNWALARIKLTFGNCCN